MPHTKQRKGTVVSLDDYREQRDQRVPTIEIKLQPGGKVEYSTPGVNDDNAFQALVGCYAVAGKLLKSLSDKMARCGTNGCGGPE